MLRYAITPGGCTQQQLYAAAERCRSNGIDYLQLREPQMPAADLLAAARTLLSLLRSPGTAPPAMPTAGPTRLLINARLDVALAAGADGVHLTARPGELTIAQCRQLWTAAYAAPAAISVSCHTLDEVRRAHADGADLILFGPVFEKRVDGQLVTAGCGVDALAAACQAAPGTPVLALGGVTQENTIACLQAGAAGVAGIRLFA